MKYIIVPSKKTIHGYCYGCGSQCQNYCGTQCEYQQSSPPVTCTYKVYSA